MRRLATALLVLLLASAASAHAAASYVFPLKVSSTGRYLTDQNDQAFLIVGDSPQGLMAHLSLTEAETYFANRASYGVDAVQIHLFAGPTFGGRTDFSTSDGITPFTTSGDVSSPRESYFARVDAVLQIAANHGIVVFLTAAETIDGLALFRSNGATKCRAFGRFLGNRYKGVPNIVWNFGNDFQTWTDPADNAVILAVSDGIRDNDSNHLQTAWLDFFLSASRDSPDWDGRIAVDLGYTYYPTYDVILRERALSPAKPVFLGETNYEGESLRGYVTTAFVVRKQMWWAMTSGATGHFYSNEDIWRFVSGWAARLDSFEGLAEIPHLTQLCRDYGWETWAPDSSHSVLTAGYGTYAGFETGSIDTNNYATAAISATRNVFVAYIPTQRQVTIDMSQLTAGTARCRWYDPRDGTFTAIGTFDTLGTRNFTPPDSNDWVLLLDVLPPPTGFYTLSPCRAADTRTAGSPLVANATRTFPVAGKCLVPADATAVALNLTVVNATDRGNLRVYPSGSAAPSTSAINFTAGTTRANNAIAQLGLSGQVNVRCIMPTGSTGTSDLVLDVYGYFK